jgi:FMN phosphatase YigB (HAD superfamily)
MSPLDGLGVSSSALIMKYSFDIFDTLLTRKVADPADVFVACGKQAVSENLVEIEPYVYSALRFHAELLARDAVGGEFVLGEIYKQLTFLLGLHKNSSDQLMEIELEAERAAIFAVPSALELLNAARESSGNVVFITDMYLPKDFLIEILRRHSLWVDGDFIYISGEIRKCKRDGGLFKHVLVDRGLSPHELTHTGNDAEADIRSCTKLGIRARRDYSANLTRFERLMRSGAGQAGDICRNWASASRIARLATRSTSEQEVGIAKIAAGVAAPALCAFVVWILRRAQDNHLDRLYFLARDGQILLEIARIFAPAMEIDVELRYLYASRQAWRLPNTDLTGAPDIQWALHDADHISCESLLARLGVPRNGVENLFANAGFPLSSWSHNLNHRERAILFDLLNSDVVAKLVADSTTERAERFVAYLRQEGLFSGLRSGVIDVGWHRTLQSSLENAARVADAPPPMGFYFGLFPGSELDVTTDDECFFFDGRKQLGIFPNSYWIEPLIEPFCAADHGTTLDYGYNGDFLEPILKTTENKVYLEWGLLHFRDVVFGFANEISSQCALPLYPRAMLPILDQLFSEFWLNPQLDEARAWGACPHFDDQTDHSCRHLAEPLGLLHTLKSIKAGSIVPPFRGGWQGGSLRLSSWWIRKCLPPAMHVSRRIREFVS